MGVDPDGNTEGPGQAKVCQFDDALVINQKVLGLQVAVEDPPSVTEVNALKDLIEVAL